MRTALVSGLVFLLLLQGASLGSRFFLGVKKVPLRIGEEFPFAVSGWESEISSGPPGSGPCRTAFIVSTHCPFCSRLAAHYADKLRADTPEDLRPSWFVLADSYETLVWAHENHLREAEVFPLFPKRRLFFQRPLVGRVWGTPMRLVLTPILNVQDARPADNLLSREELDSLCSVGGIAPESYEVLRDLISEEGRK